MRWGWAAAAAAVQLIVCGTAGAQYLSYDAARRGAELSQNSPSRRLEAMGGLYLVVPDENNEINLHDFGGNLAGVVDDRQGWSVESWFGRDNSILDENIDYRGDVVRQRSRFDLERGGLDVVYRREAKQALGMTLWWRGYDARLTYGPNSRVSGPDSRFFYNRTFGRLSAAVGVTTASDKEDLVSSDVFSIYHTSTTRRFTAAAAWALGAATTVGAQLDADRVRIEGQSADPPGFHRDEFDWRRPSTQMRVTLVRPEGPGALAFGVNLGRLSREGTEEAAISWSDRFPENPGRFNYSIRIPSFTEEEDAWDLEGRVSWRFAPSLRLGGNAVYRKLDSTVHESVNSDFPGSRREEDATLTSWRLGAGIGSVLRGGRLRTGVEGGLAASELDSKRPREAVSLETRTYDLRVGAEYLIPGDLAIRAGYQARSHDQAVGEPASLGLSNGLTFGFGWVPRGGLVAIDTYLRVWKEDPDVAGTADRKAEDRDLGVSARFLF